MAFNRMAGDHRFDFSCDVCVRCGMTREYFEDNGEPHCDGQPNKRLENDPRFLRRIEKARASVRAGRGVRLEDVDSK